MTTAQDQNPLPKGAIKLMLTAEKLFGEQGVEGVSLRQIVTAAGQANSSAVQHHFGSKEGLLQAVFDMRLPALDEARMALLLSFKDKHGHIAMPQLLRAMYWPVINDMNETAQKSFALFNSQLMHIELARHPFTHTKVPQPAFREIYDRLRQHLSYLPKAVFDVRMRLATEIFLGALSERRRIKTIDENPYPSREAYWREIFLAIEAVFRIPFTGPDLGA